LVDRTGVSPSEIVDIFVGSVNRQCSSGLQAVAIKDGFYDIGISVGLEFTTANPMA